MVLLGTLTGEDFMGEADEISVHLSLLLQGGEHVVEVDRDFEGVGLFSILLQPGELVVQMDTMSAVLFLEAGCEIFSSILQAMYGLM